MRETFSSHRRRHSFNAFLSLRASLLISLCVLCASLVPLCSAQGTGKDLAVLAGRSAEYILGCELDGTLFAVDAESGDVRWRLENPTKTFFRASASVADLTEALRKNDSLKAPLFVPSLDGGLFFFTETGSFQQLSKSAKDIVMNPPFITEDGSVLIGKKDTQIFVIELATGRVIDSVVASDDDPIASMPFTGHWPPGCVLISASTYTVKGLHPLSPENKWSVVLTEYLPVLTTLVDEGPNTAPASGSAFLVSPSGDMYCVDENSRVVWTLPWTAQLAAVFRITFSTAGTGRIAREELTLVSDKVKPSALSLDHAPVYVGQLNGQLFAAPYKKAISGAQLNRPGLLQIAPPVEVEEPEVCLMNGSIVGIHLLPTPSSTALLPADTSAIVPSPSPLTLPSSSPQSETPLAAPRSNFVFTAIALGVICILGGYIAIDIHKRRRAARAASLASPPVPLVAEISTEEAGAIEPADPTLTAKRKKKKHQQQQGVLTRGDAPAPPSPATSSSPTDSTPAVTPSPAAAPVEPALPPGVKRVGKIELQMERILGYGSNGTVVYEGCFDGRRVAVKRLLRTMYDVASKEVTLFVESDEHPHVVRYFAKEEDGDFIYLALTLCVATLEDLISPPPDKVPIAPVVAPPISVIVLQLALGLQHLHALHIIHRDLKPANVLLDHRAVVRIADMGLARKMGPDEFSVSGGSLKSAMAGSLGWRPPEICKVHHAALADPTASPGAARLHLSKKMDIFALGCIFYYVVTKGKHPFGQPFEREANILANRYRLDDPRCPYEAADLIRSMINPEPKLRPNIEQVLKHPFFWDANKKLLFFRDASDRVEVEKANAPVVLALEARAPSVIGGAGWGAVVDAEMLDNGGKYRKYNFGSIRDLLRVIRNKSHHYRDLPLTVQARIGSLPDGFLAYFMSRFPGLLLEVYRILQHYYPGEPALRQYM